MMHFCTVDLSFWVSLGSAESVGTDDCWYKKWNRELRCELYQQMINEYFFKEWARPRAYTDAVRKPKVDTVCFEDPHAT